MHKNSNQKSESGEREGAIRRDRDSDRRRGKIKAGCQGVGPGIWDRLGSESESESDRYDRYDRYENCEI